MGRMEAYEFRKDRALGDGGFSCVYEGYNPSSKRVVAVKECRFTSAFEASAFHNETKVIQAVQNRPCSKYFVKTYLVDESSTEGWIVMKKYDGDLLQQAFKPMSERKLKPIALRICRAVQALHLLGIAHMDIKPENVLMKGNRAYLTDFGADVWSLDTAIHPRVGTTLYKAPELSKQESTNRINPFQADIFSLGVLLHVCLTSMFPFTHPGFLDLSFAEANLSRRAFKLISSMLSTNPAKRPPIDEVLASNFFRSSWRTSL